MKKENIITKVHEIIMDKMGLNHVESQYNLDTECEMDSLDKIEFVMSLEKEFNISISDDEVENLNTVSDVYDIVCKKLNL